ncbi:hypothetical protein MUK42_00885 [Musa troglodytarum]|uniref:Uncharacterized protein n=1 Tax=Musa troglodytarum TaxID=320322 RepID=A0A9E7JSH6_9LILI|nr:hypothetical protein MUK42_00885 [Musa troglodytarum]
MERHREARTKRGSCGASTTGGTASTLYRKLCKHISKQMRQFEDTLEEPNQIPAPDRAIKLSHRTQENFNMKALELTTSKDIGESNNKGSCPQLLTPSPEDDPYYSLNCLTASPLPL